MVFTNPLSLAAGNVQEFPPAKMVTAAAAAGFEHTGIWVEPDEWTETTTKEVRARLAASPVSVLDVEVIWIHPGDDDPNLERIIDIGGALDAQFALVVSSDPDRAATKRRWAALCEHASGAGVKLVLEFLPITEVKTLTDAVDVVTDVGHPNGGILVDSLHLARTNNTPADVGALDKSLFPYVQIADAPAKAPEGGVPGLLNEAVDGRLLPGEGALPVRELLEAVTKNIAVSPEIRSKALRDQYPDITDRAKAIATSVRRFMNG